MSQWQQPRFRSTTHGQRRARARAHLGQLREPAELAAIAEGATGAPDDSGVRLYSRVCACVKKLYRRGRVSGCDSGLARGGLAGRAAAAGDDENEYEPAIASDTGDRRLLKRTGETGAAPTPGSQGRRPLSMHSPCSTSASLSQRRHPVITRHQAGNSCAEVAHNAPQLATVDETHSSLR